MKIANLLFCCAAIGGSLLLARMAFPLAALPRTAIEAARTPQGAEMFEDVELGDFGTVSVLDMVQHYIDNPPAPGESGSKREVRFQGC